MEDKSRHLATIQLIADIRSIPDADSIEVVRVLGWECVAKKGEFKVGDKCLYCEIDSLLPENEEAFQFLSKGTKAKSVTIDSVTYTGFRLKTVRLRGQVSQGLALPVRLWSEFSDLPVGTDVSSTLKVVKYEPPLPAQLTGKVKGYFPSFIQKTDEIRIQSEPDLLNLIAGHELVITEKLDGTSFTAYAKDGAFGVCGRNIEFKIEDTNSYCNKARDLHLEEKLLGLGLNIAIQGELIGSNIQGNPYNRSGHELFVFNVWDIDKSQYYDDNAYRELCDKLDLQKVPLIARLKKESYTVEDFLKLASRKSVIKPETEAEGIVVRAINPVDKKLIDFVTGIEKSYGKVRVSFKCISPNYLLTHDN